MRSARFSASLIVVMITVRSMASSQNEKPLEVYVVQGGELEAELSVKGDGRLVGAIYLEPNLFRVPPAGRVDEVLHQLLGMPFSTLRRVGEDAERGNIVALVPAPQHSIRHDARPFQHHVVLVAPFSPAQGGGRGFGELVGMKRFVDACCLQTVEKVAEGFFQGRIEILNSGHRL